MTQVRYFAAGDHATPVKTVDFTYDGLGNLKTYGDGTTTGTYIYDDLSQKIAETIDYGAFTKTIGYDYYANGQKKSFTGPDGAAVSYSYDEGNRLSAITIPGIGQITTNAYHWNSPARVTLPGGSTTDYTYDPLMRMKTLTSKDPAQNTVVSRSYTYSPVGNMTEKATEHGSYGYTYDKLDRVLSAANPAAANEAYTYDGLGNRLTSAATTGAWAYNTNNELQGFDDAAFGYDANGNMTGRTQGAANISYQYDVENRLVEVEAGGGATIATYYYDPFGRRLWKEVAGARTYFLYSDEGLIGEYDSLGNELRAYGYAPGSAFSTDPLFQKSGGAYYWYRNDHLGTPQKVTSTSGSVAWAGEYDTFGNVTITSQAGFTSNLRFGGQYFDAETGLYYNYNRYYDPTLGRYLQSDPYGDGINLYAYVYNNPNSLFDPMGLCAVKNFFTLDGQAQFWAGFGDFLTSGFGISYMFGLPSLTQYARAQWQQAFGWDDPIDLDSDLYAAGAFAGDVVASILGEALVAKTMTKMGMCKKVGWPCFVAGTLVHTADGLRPIEEIKAGDLVLARDEVSGEITFKEVVRTFVTPDQGIVSIDVEDEDGASDAYEATADHPFWVKARGWVGASDLKPGDEIFSSTGGWLRVTGSTWLSKRQTVYNFEVKDFHTYFVGESGAWVHNSCKKTHGNSRASTKAQHGYEIIDTHNKDAVVKTGVSGRKLNINETSHRANAQANRWNREPGNEVRYQARVVKKVPEGPGAREEILQWEKINADKHRPTLDPERHVKP